MADIQHKTLAYTEQHVAHFKEYANAAARTGAAGLTGDDDYKIALQTDDHSLWILSDYSGPTWVAVALTADASITAAKLATNAVETAKIKNANVTKDKLGADCVDDTKIGDAKVKKEHIHADVVGAGLSGGAGTALSVDGIKDAGGTELKVKIINIGAWNMDTTSYVNIAHGLTLANIRHTEVFIRRDDAAILSPLYSAGYWNITAANVALSRDAAGAFDSANYDTMGGDGNRGWITVWYTV